MSDKKLKISADVSEVKRSLLDIKQTINKNLAGSNIQLFSKKSEEFIKKDAKKYLEQMTEASKKVTESIEKQIEKLSKATQGTKQYVEEYKKLTKLTENLANIEKQKSTLGAISEQGMGAKAPGFLGKFIEKGGLGGGLSKLAGMSGMGLLAGATAGAGAYGLYQMYKGFGKYEEGTPARLKLRGRGVNSLTLNRGEASEAAAYGLNMNDVLGSRAEAMDIFGKKGASTGSILQRARMERGFGLESGTFNAMGAAFRPQMGSGRANEATMKLQASLIASGIDDAIGPYLETAASMLTKINQNGLSDSAQVLGALADLSKKTGEAPEIIAQQLSTVDAAMKNSTGERNAFLQMAFAKANIGGKSIGGTQAAVHGGLFGSDISMLPKEMRDQFESLGLGNTVGFQKRASAIVDQMKNSGYKWGKGATATQTLQAGRFAQGMGWAPNEEQGANVVSLLERASKGEDVKKQLEQAGKDPQIKNLENVNQSLEGQLNIQKNMKDSLDIIVGELTGPTAKLYRQALIDLAPAVSGAAKMTGAGADILGTSLGISGSAKDRLNNAKEGSGKYMPNWIGFSAMIRDSIINAFSSNVSEPVVNAIKESTQANVKVTSDVSKAIKTNKGKTTGNGGKSGKTY